MLDDYFENVETYGINPTILAVAADQARMAFWAKLHDLIPEIEGGDATPNEVVAFERATNEAIVSHLWGNVRGHRETREVDGEEVCECGADH